MRIQSIVLENYRQYRDKVNIDLSIDPEKNFNIIIGANGSGKTNLLNAINWCLYNKEDHLQKYSKKQQPIVNDAALKELKNGKRIDVQVTLKMKEEKGRSIIFERRGGGWKDDKGEFNEDPKRELEVFMEINRDMNKLSEGTFILNRLLPDGVKNFFFFDGENLDEFFKEEKSNVIRDAIHDVSQLSLLDEAMTHLERTGSKMRQEVKGESPRIDEITAMIDAIEKGRDTNRDEKISKEKKLTDIKNILAEVSKKLRVSGEPQAEELQNKRDRLEDETIKVEHDLDEANEEVNDRVTRIGPIIWSMNSIKKALKEIGGKTKKGKLPLKIRDTFVKELLEVGRCICGTDISTENSKRDKVKNLLRTEYLSAISDEVDELKYVLNNCMKDTSKFITDQNKLRKRVRDLESRSETMGLELRDIEEKLKGINVEEIKNLELTHEKLTKQKEDLIVEISHLKARIDRAKLELEKSQGELDSETRKSTKYDLIRKKMDVCNRTLKLFTQIKKDLTDEIRNTIDNKTESYFLSLVWKKDTYKDIIIDDNYDVSVINNLDSECIGTLSAGERQVLALSFLASLREVSGFNAPIIIDTPLGRISSEPKENIAKLLPKFLKKTQVTMFMTDEEYTPEVRKLLKNKVGREYQLVHDESKSKTIVKPYV